LDRTTKMLHELKSPMAALLKTSEFPASVREPFRKLLNEFVNLLFQTVAFAGTTRVEIGCAMDILAAIRNTKSESDMTKLCHALSEIAHKRTECKIAKELSVAYAAVIEKAIDLQSHDIFRTFVSSTGQSIWMLTMRAVGFGLTCLAVLTGITFVGSLGSWYLGNITMAETVVLATTSVNVCKESGITASSHFTAAADYSNCSEAVQHVKTALKTMEERSNGVKIQLGHFEKQLTTAFVGMLNKVARAPTPTVVLPFVVRAEAECSTSLLRLAELVSAAEDAIKALSTVGLFQR